MNKQIYGGENSAAPKLATVIIFIFIHHNDRNAQRNGTIEKYIKKEERRHLN